MNFTWLRVAACAVTLAFLPTALPMPAMQDIALAQAYPPRKVEFNGKQLYQAAFEAIRNQHIDLMEEAARDAWSKQWEHKFDNDTALTTEAGTDEAIRTMLASLGKRYDRYFGTDFVLVKDTLANEGTASIGVVLKARVVQTDKGPRREIYVERLLPGSPAEGLIQPGDVLKLVDCAIELEQDNTGCREVANMSGPEVELALYGKAGSDIIVHIVRNQGHGPVELRVKVTRKDMTEHAVFLDWHGDCAVIRIVNFLPADFEKQFEAALKQAAGAKSIVFDLRGNPGGRTDAAVNAIGNLLEQGKINVVLQRQGAFTLRQEIAANGEFFQVTIMRVNVGQRFPIPRPPLLVAPDVRIAVLIDSKSASASEIFAGALKANKRAVIVGEKSLGKGEGQEVVELPFGRRLHVTTFEFRAGGVAHNLVGIQPDVTAAASTAGGADTQLEAAIKAVCPPASEKAE